MSDPRFYTRAGPFRLGALAEIVGATLARDVDADFLVEDVAALDCAGPTECSFYTHQRHRAVFAASNAGVVITRPEWVDHSPVSIRLLFAPEPRSTFAEVGHLFYPPDLLEPLISDHARIDVTATIGQGCRIEPGAVIGPRASIGPGCHIGANTVIGASVVIGADCRIGPNTTISHALIGDRVEIFSNVTIGSQGFGFVAGRSGILRVPQLGRVVIHDDVEIGAQCAIDRGANSDTVIGAGCRFDNAVHIGHNVQIGRNCLMAAQVGIAGSTIIGDGVMVSGQVAISDHLTIGAGARIAWKSGVTRDVPPQTSVGGYPALPIREWHRRTAILARLARPRSAS